MKPSESLSPAGPAAGPNPPPVRFWRAFLLYFGLVALAGALLAPWLYQGLLAVAGWLNIPYLSDQPFRRVADRAFMLVGLPGLWLWLRYLALHQRADWGLAGGVRVALGGLWLGLAIGVASMGALVLMEWAIGLHLADARRALWQTPPAAGAVAKELLRLLLASLFSGLVIGCIEEVFFRGALMTAMQRRHGVRTAIIGSALLYALLHFVRSKPPPGEVTWQSGFQILASLADGVWQVENLGTLLALVLVGLLLALLRVQRGHLWLSIGLHAGWVMMIKVSRYYGNFKEGHAWGWLVGPYDDHTGYLGCCLLLPAVVILAWRQRRQRVPVASPAIVEAAP